jgi:hypothetical protein
MFDKDYCFNYIINYLNLHDINLIAIFNGMVVLFYIFNDAILMAFILIFLLVYAIIYIFVI